MSLRVTVRVIFQTPNFRPHIPVIPDPSEEMIDETDEDISSGSESVPEQASKSKRGFVYPIQNSKLEGDVMDIKG